MRIVIASASESYRNTLLAHLRDDPCFSGTSVILIDDTSELPGSASETGEIGISRNSEGFGDWLTNFSALRF